MNAKVPILSGVKRRTFTCLSGHTYEGPGPLTMKMQIGSRVGESGPFCPVCYVDWFGKTFPVVEVKGE